jgi:DNA-binding GntR family transcriptional regulator
MLAMNDTPDARPQDPLADSPRRTSRQTAAERITPPSGSLAPQAPRSAEIVSTLARELADGLIAPGRRLEEEALCERFGASRTPVREALRQLAAQGMVEIRPRQGAFVVQLPVDKLAEMFETMGFLEAACAALAARRHTPEDRDALALAHQACISAALTQNPDLFYAANNHFHECVYRASHNGFLEQQTLGLRNQVEAYRRASTFHAGFMALSIREHEAVMEAILAVDEQAAATRMSQHLDTLRHDAVSMAKVVARLAERS